MKEKLYNLLHKRPPKNSALFSSIVCSLLKDLFAGVGVRVDLILQLFTAPFLLLTIPSSVSGQSEDNNDDPHLIMTSFLSFSGDKSRNLPSFWNVSLCLFCLCHE